MTYFIESIFSASSIFWFVELKFLQRDDEMFQRFLEEVEQRFYMDEFQIRE